MVGGKGWPVGDEEVGTASALERERAKPTHELSQVDDGMPGPSHGKYTSKMYRKLITREKLEMQRIYSRCRTACNQQQQSRQADEPCTNRRYQAHRLVGKTECIARCAQIREHF